MNENPHNIVLNQVLNFSQAAFPKTAESGTKEEVSKNIREHWIDVSEQFKGFGEGLKKFAMLDPENSADQIIKSKISCLLDIYNSMDSRVVQEITNSININ